MEALVHNLRRASFTVHARFRMALAHRGLSMGQFLVLRSLVSEGRGTPRDLAKSLGVTTGNITGLVDKLEAEALIVRDRSRSDRRVVHLKATKKGQSLMGELQQAVVAQTAKAFESWSEGDLRRLNLLLRRVIEDGTCNC